MSFNYDTWGNKLYNMPYGLYLYYLNPNLFNGSFQGTTYDNTSVVGNSGAVQALLYTPFIDESDIDYFKTPYDTERFGSTDGNRPQIKNSADVYRITNHRVVDKLLGSFQIYAPSKSIGGRKSHLNEGKIYQYPYIQLMVTDHISQPLLLKPHLCGSSNVRVRTSISAKCTYNLYVENYKGDTRGALEGSILNGSLDLPVSSSAYSNFISSSKAQYTANTVMGVATSALSIASGEPSLMVAGLTQGVENISGALTKMTDLNNTPKTMSTMGGDVPFSTLNSEKKVEFIRFVLDVSDYERLGDYFDRYGYKQSKFMIPNLRNRYYHNYIKTMGCVIDADIDHEDKQELETIYNNGVTIYHYRNGVVDMSHTMDNYEV